MAVEAVVVYFYEPNLSLKTPEDKFRAGPRGRYVERRINGQVSFSQLDALEPREHVHPSLEERRAELRGYWGGNDSDGFNFRMAVVEALGLEDGHATFDDFIEKLSLVSGQNL
jgi:hypothetical protein